MLSVYVILRETAPPPPPGGGRGAGTWGVGRRVFRLGGGGGGGLCWVYVLPRGSAPPPPAGGGSWQETEDVVLRYSRVRVRVNPDRYLRIPRTQLYKYE